MYVCVCKITKCRFLNVSHSICLVRRRKEDHACSFVVVLICVYAGCRGDAQLQRADPRDSVSEEWLDVPQHTVCGRSAPHPPLELRGYAWSSGRRRFWPRLPSRDDGRASVFAACAAAVPAADVLAAAATAFLLAAAATTAAAAAAVSCSPARPQTAPSAWRRQQKEPWPRCIRERRGAGCGICPVS